MTHLRTLLVVLAMSSFAGCVHIDSSHVLTGSVDQPSSPSQVTIYMEGQDPPPGYREIAIVEGRGNGRAGMPAVLERLKQDAARLGANALLNTRIDQGGSIISVTAVAVRY